MVCPSTARVLWILGARFRLLVRRIVRRLGTSFGNSQLLLAKFNIVCLSSCSFYSVDYDCVVSEQVTFLICFNRVLENMPPFSLTLNFGYLSGRGMFSERPLERRRDCTP